MRAKTATKSAPREGKRVATPAQERVEVDRQAHPQRSHIFIAVGVLAAVVLLCYANTLWNGFVFDDHNHALRNRLFRSLSNIPQLVVASYRPIRDISYTLDFALWGQSAFGFHLTNVLIHLFNTLLAFVLFRRFGITVLGAGFAALVFAIHPVQPDSVTYISGRRDLLFSFFYLLGLHSYLSYRSHLDNRQTKSGGRAKVLAFLGLFLVCWALGLMSKEMAVSLPLVILVWNFCDAWPRVRGSWWGQAWKAIREALRRDKWLYIALVLVAPAYAAYMVFIKGGSIRARMSGFSYWGGSFYTNALTVVRVHAWYLKQLVYPTPMVQYEGVFDVSTSVFDWRVILSIIIVSALIAGGFVALRWNKLIAFAVLSYFAILLPVSHIIPHHELLADHYLYLPVAVFGLCSAVLMQKVSNRRPLAGRAVYGVCIGAIIVFAIMTILRNRVYKDDLSLWQANYREAPTSIRAVSSLAGAYAKSYPAKAAELYKECIRLDPSYAPAYVSLAYLYQTRQSAREVEELILQGLALPESEMTSPGYENPNRFRSEMTTGLALAKSFQQERQEAERLLWQAIELYPVNPQPYSLLAVYYNSVDPAKEIEVLKKQVAVNPNGYEPLLSLSNRLIESRRYDEAIPYLGRILAQFPDDFYGNYQLGQVYRSMKECSGARSYLAVAERAAAGTEEAKAVKDALAGLQQQCAD